MSQRVLVTGGGRGVGAAIVQAIVAAGCDVDFTFRRSEVDAKNLVAALADKFPARSVTPHRIDLEDRHELDQFCEDIEDLGFFGLVHNAGQSYDALAATLAQDRAELAMQVNFWTLTRLAKSLIRSMVRERSGRIIAIGSAAATVAGPGNGAYAASKAALHAYCRTLAIETAKRGVTVNVIAPGFVDTEMMAPYAGHRERMEKQIPIGRFSHSDEVAALAAFLLGREAASITGAVLPIDGGLTAMMGVHR